MTEKPNFTTRATSAAQAFKAEIMTLDQGPTQRLLLQSIDIALEAALEYAAQPARPVFTGETVEAA